MPPIRGGNSSASQAPVHSKCLLTAWAVGARGGGQDSDDEQRWPRLSGRPQTQTRRLRAPPAPARTCLSQRRPGPVSRQPEPSPERGLAPGAPSCPLSSGHRCGSYPRAALSLRLSSSVSPFSAELRELAATGCGNPAFSVYAGLLQTSPGFLAASFTHTHTHTHTHTFFACSYPLPGPSRPGFPCVLPFPGAAPCPAGSVSPRVSSPPVLPYLSNCGRTYTACHLSFNHP